MDIVIGLPGSISWPHHTLAVWSGTKYFTSGLSLRICKMEMTDLHGGTLGGVRNGITYVFCTVPIRD